MTDLEGPVPVSAAAVHDAEAEIAVGQTAVRDAQAVAARVSADEAAADSERARLTREPLAALTDDIEPGLRLDPDEMVHAIRRTAILEHRGSDEVEGGTLYLTTRRLVHIGSKIRDLDLRAITEIAVSLERLLLIDLVDGSDLAIEVDQPRLLRVQLSAARAAARERAG